MKIYWVYFPLLSNRFRSIYIFRSSFSLKSYKQQTEFVIWNAFVDSINVEKKTSYLCVIEIIVHRLIRYVQTLFFPILFWIVKRAFCCHFKVNEKDRVCVILHINNVGCLALMFYFITLLFCFFSSRLHSTITNLKVPIRLFAFLFLYFYI